MIFLVVFQGPTGIGKTTLANALARRLQVPVVDKDDIKDIIFPSLGDTKSTGAASINVMWNIAEKQLKNGLSVICDYPLGWVSDYLRAIELAAKYNAKLAVVDCECSQESVWKDRIETRATEPSHPGHKARTWEEARSFFNSFVRVEIEDAIKIDTSDSLEENVERILLTIQ